MRNAASASAVLAILLLSIQCVAFATPDPITITPALAADTYATTFGNSRKLFRDAYGKYIAVHKYQTVFLEWCNNDPPTSGWSVQNLGVNFVVNDNPDPPYGMEFGVAAAYDPIGDRLMVAWTGGDNFKAARITFTRDGDGDITGYSTGAILTITPSYDVAHSPSLWLLHNGEVAAIWGADTVDGAKSSQPEFCRLVFGSPPTHKNAAGTASATDLLGTDYSGGHTIRYPTIVERTNSGTGQYDLYAFSSSSDAGNWKYKATWSGSSWSWGSETSVSIDPLCSNYDSTNGLIVYCSVSSTSIDVRTISSSDTDTSISKTGLSSNTRECVSLAIDDGDYYFFYYNFKSSYQSIWYIRRMAGTWDSDETLFAESPSASQWYHYPSCKVDGAGNRIELIWTHYTLSGSYVLYDYLSLGPVPEFPMGPALVMAICFTILFAVRRRYEGLRYPI